MALTTTIQTCGHTTQWYPYGTDEDARTAEQLRSNPCHRCRIEQEFQAEHERTMARLRAEQSQPAAQPESDEVCGLCGERASATGLFCTMSEDGEGEHVFATREPRISPDDARRYGRIARHLEQGAQEIGG